MCTWIAEPPKKPADAPEGAAAAAGAAGGAAAAEAEAKAAARIAELEKQLQAKEERIKELTYGSGGWDMAAGWWGGVADVLPD